MKTKKLAFAALLSIAYLNVNAYSQSNTIARIQRADVSLAAAKLESGFNYDLARSAAAPDVTSRTTVASATLTELYRVGVNDVLDIQLVGLPTSESTLFTVMQDGLLDYPFAGDAVKVSGLTTGEIANLLHERIRVFENPQVDVTVRDYASHSVIIKGFVASPGPRVLRREAVPLFVVLSEAQQLPEAKRVTIIRKGSQRQTIDLSDSNDSSALVYSGDVITVEGAPLPEAYFFAGGHVASPGQKPYHIGLTLTQAILACGGITADGASLVRLARQGADGRLITTEYNLAEVILGHLPDPSIEQGDRLEVPGR